MTPGRFLVGFAVLLVCGLIAAGMGPGAILLLLVVGCCWVASMAMRSGDRDE
jgi:hypothetical protein